MRWRASEPVTWPGDDQWQRAWAAALQPVLSTSPEPDGAFVVPAGAPPVRVVSGTHLQVGADYRIAPELTRGVLRGWVAAQRSVGLEWAPHDETGRAHVEVHGLDRIDAARAQSDLAHLTGQARFDLQHPDDLMEVRVELDWLACDLTARVQGGRLEVEAAVRGRGVWRPTLAPLFAAGSARIQRGLQQQLYEVAEAVDALTHEPTKPARGAGVPTPAELKSRHHPQIQTGMFEAARRQHAVADALGGSGWWGRGKRRWRTELTALPPAVWPSADPLTGSWDDVERRLTAEILQGRRGQWPDRIDDRVTTLTAVLLASSDSRDDVVAAQLRPTADPEPWLTDATLDLRWLRSPWSVVRHLTGAAHRPGLS